MNFLFFLIASLIMVTLFSMSLRLSLRFLVSNKWTKGSYASPRGWLDTLPIYSFLRSQKTYSNEGETPPVIYFASEIFSAFIIPLILYLHHPDYVYITILICSYLVITLIISTIIEHNRAPDILILTLGAINITCAFYNHYTLSQVLLMPVLLTLISVLANSLTKLSVGSWLIDNSTIKILALSAPLITPEQLIHFFILCMVLGLPLSLIWRNISATRTFPEGIAILLTLFLQELFLNVTI